MAKKNKKKNPQQIKLEQAHQKNLYLNKIKAMMGVMGNQSAFDLLDDREIEVIYLSRLRPYKFINSEKETITMESYDLKKITETLNMALRKCFIYPGETQTPVSMYDFFIYTETLYQYLKNIDSSTFVNAEKVKEMLPAFNEHYTSLRMNAYHRVSESIDLLAFSISNTVHHIVWFEPEPIKQCTSALDNSAAFNNYLVHIVKPETELLTIDGNTRTIYRLGIVRLKEIEWLTITPKDLGVYGVLKDLPLKIFIQMHVIERIKERLGSFFVQMNFLLTMTAISEKDICRADDGSFLITYHYMKIKLGYLKADIIGDKLLIRTFLFITNNGTPEAKKLATLLGVQKEDKKYLGIDKLNTFIHSDIEQNEKLKKIFEDAGCGGLFDIKQNLQHVEEPIIRCADHLLQYLGMENKDLINVAVEA